MKGKALEAFLPIVGVAGLLAIWFVTAHNKWVDPVLLPPPAAAFQAFWKGMDGGALGFDFVKTVYRTAAATLIASVRGRADGTTGKSATRAGWRESSSTRSAR